MDDSGSLSKRRRALVVAHLIGWMARDFVLYELAMGTMFVAVLAMFCAVAGTNPVGQVTAAIVGVVGLSLVVRGIHAQWPARQLWLVVAPLVFLEPIAASLAFIHS